MTVFVPFDGSPLSRSALVRAGEFARPHDRQVLTVTVVPEPASYATEKGWLAPDEDFDRGTIETRLRASVYRLLPGARFKAHHVADRLPKGAIANRLRRHANQQDVEAVFVGSENAGRVITPLTSVASSVASDEAYDVYIARRIDDDCWLAPVHEIDRSGAATGD